MTSIALGDVIMIMLLTGVKRVKSLFKALLERRGRG